MWSVVPISNFYGIELTDFGAETAKLALFIAEYQANALFKGGVRAQAGGPAAPGRGEHRL